MNRDPSPTGGGWGEELIGFLPVSEVRVRGTIEAIEHQLSHDGFVSRYETVSDVDGLSRGGASFLLCSFRLADCLERLGRHDATCRLFERLVEIRNDVGLLAEGCDADARQLAGNFPQGLFAHRTGQHGDESLEAQRAGCRSRYDVAETGRGAGRYAEPDKSGRL